MGGDSSIKVTKHSMVQIGTQIHVRCTMLTCTVWGIYMYMCTITMAGNVGGVLIFVTFVVLLLGVLHGG